MKWAIGLFVAIVLGLVGLAGWSGKLDAGLRATGRSAVEIGPILVLAVVVMGFTEVLLPQGWVERWLSDAAGPRGMAVAWLAGVLTPGGSVIGFPLAAGLLKTGASPAVVVTYVTAMGLLNILRLPLEAATYGPRVTALRVAACAVVPFVAGGIARLLTPFFR
jgi:uncharacterized membrane protein YraQ (UPF0718 family)